MIKAIVVSVALVLLLAACGGGGAASSSSSASTPSKASSPSSSSSAKSSSSSASSSTTASSAAAAKHKGETIAVTKNPKLGKILADEDGKTVYLFEKDKNGKSACSGACTQVWPPVTTKGKPQAGKGVSAAKLGTITRSNGATQVTYSGHPLYYYASDSKPGDTKGQDVKAFGAGWYVVSPSGHKVEKEEGGGGKSGGSGGGGY